MHKWEFHMQVHGYSVDDTGDGNEGAPPIAADTDRFLEYRICLLCGKCRFLKVSYGSMPLTMDQPTYTIKRKANTLQPTTGLSPEYKGFA